MEPLKLIRAIWQALGAPQAHWLAILLAFSIPASIKGQVVINEIMANNVSTIANKAGLYSDWVEIYNAGAATANIGGYGLSDTPGTNKYFFPANTLLSPHGHLMVWLDSTNGSGEFHANFSLKSSGEYVGLTAPGNILVDSNSFGLQLADMTVGRIPDGTPGTNAWTLNVPTPGLANVAQAFLSAFTTNGAVVITNLFINEWVATNSTGNSNDWLELYNQSTNPVALSGLVFSSAWPEPGTIMTNRPIPALSFIDGSGFIQFFCVGAKSVKNNDDLDFKLSHNTGETISLYPGAGATNVWIDRISFPGNNTNIYYPPCACYSNYWAQNVSYGRLPDGSTNIVKFTPSKTTPAASNFQPLTNVVINEALSHTDLPFEDAIELYNPTTDDVDISHWWLSNKPDNAFKFQIPPGTILTALTYKVFYEQRGITNVPHIGFNTGGNTDGSVGSPDPGDFTLNSAHGDSVYLFTADTNGVLTGFRRGITFGSAEHGISFGRFITSVGVDITAMSENTFGMDNPTTVQQFRSGTGLTNAYPKMGPLIINEIMYHPPDIFTGTTNGTNFYIDDGLNEYIEVYNITTNTFYLYDTNGLYFDARVTTNQFWADGRTNTWKLKGMVSFDFPTNVHLHAGEALLLVNFDPVLDPTQLNLFRSKYGIPTNVQMFGPYSGGKLKNSGGSVELDKPDPPQDFNHPDFRYVPYIQVDQVSFNDKAPWPTGPDGGGTALHRLVPERYGNEPTNWESAFPTPGWEPLRIDSSQQIGSSFVLGFRGLAGGTYSVQWKTNLTFTNWTRYTNLSAVSSTGTREVTNSLTSSNHFFRLVSPSQ